MANAMLRCACGGTIFQDVDGRRVPCAACGSRLSAGEVEMSAMLDGMFPVRRTPLMDIFNPPTPTDAGTAGET